MVIWQLGSTVVMGAISCVVRVVTLLCGWASRCSAGRCLVSWLGLWQSCSAVLRVVSWTPLSCSVCPSGPWLAWVTRLVWLIMNFVRGLFSSPLLENAIRLVFLVIVCVIAGLFGRF